MMLNEMLLISKQEIENIWEEYFFSVVEHIIIKKQIVGLSEVYQCLHKTEMLVQ